MAAHYNDGEAKRLILDIGRRMYERGYVAANDGNISIRCGEDRIWVTPTGVSKGYMTEEMLLCVGMDGALLQGEGRPSSELRMHLRVYRENPAVRCVVHAHPIAATSFAAAGIPLDKAVMIESVIGLGVVPLAPYATAGTEAVGDSIAPFCRDYNAVLLCNHGALTWGEEAMQAYYRMETLECCAQVMLNLGLLRGMQPRLLSRREVAELIAAREKNGVFSGGIPLCAEDIKENKPD